MTHKYLLCWKDHGDGVMVEWGTTVGKEWEVIFSWIVNKIHSCLMLLRNLFFFTQCRDTYWIESLHLMILIYTPKRIHFSWADTDEMRIQLAILDWNENVLREASSLQFYQTSRQPDRIAPHRVLTEKTYKFKEEIWEKFFSALQISNIRHCLQRKRQ